MHIIFFAVVVLLLFIMVFYMSWISASRVSEYLSGVWVGDSTFLEKSSLRDIQLFIAPGGSSRSAYLIMTDTEGNFISNQPITISLSGVDGYKTMFATSNDESVIRADVEYDVHDVMPSELTMKLSLLNGTLALHDGDKIYAFLVKDIAMSLVGIEAYNDRE